MVTSLMNNDISETMVSLLPSSASKSAEPYISWKRDHTDGEPLVAESIPTFRDGPQLSQDASGTVSGQ